VRSRARDFLFLSWELAGVQPDSRHTEKAYHKGKAEHNLQSIRQPNVEKNERNTCKNGRLNVQTPFVAYRHTLQCGGLINVCWTGGTPTVITIKKTWHNRDTWGGVKILTATNHKGECHASRKDIPTFKSTGWVIATRIVSKRVSGVWEIRWVREWVRVCVSGWAERERVSTIIIIIIGVENNSDSRTHADKCKDTGGSDGEVGEFQQISLLSQEWMK